jgi:vancomycin resistance protein YoaR
MSRHARDAEASDAASEFDAESAAGGADGSSDGPRKGRRGTRVAIGLGATVAVLAAAYFGVAWFVGDKVPTGTVVAGVQIGGMTQDEAIETLRTELADEIDAPVVIRHGEDEVQISSAEAGLPLDEQSTVERLTGFALDPRVLLGHFTGYGSAEPIRTVDEPALFSAIEAASADLGSEPVDGAITFEDGAAVVTDPVDGESIDVEATAELVTEDWLVDTAPIEAVMVAEAPEIDADDVALAQSEIVDPLTSGPVTVQVGDNEVELDVDTLTSAATIDAVNGGLALSLDGDALVESILSSGDGIADEPVDARITLRDGAPYIVGGENGAELNPENVAAAVGQAAVSSDDRVATVEAEEVEPDLTTEEARELGVDEVVAEIETPLTNDDVRTQNLVNAARLVNGTLILPGEQFNLADVLGPITEENGYVSSGVVENGFNAEALGGGISQMSTNTFNIGFLAGYDDIAHRPHSKWFDRYPAGRESTIWIDTDNPENSIDMIWENNTPYAGLVEAWVADGYVHTRLWSTEYWDVDIVSSDHYNITPPQNVVNNSPGCVPEPGGVNGFSITVTRDRSHGDEVLPTETLDWTYSPHNRVTCG